MFKRPAREEKSVTVYNFPAKMRLFSPSKSVFEFCTIIVTGHKKKYLPSFPYLPDEYPRVNIKPHSRWRMQYSLIYLPFLERNGCVSLCTQVKCPYPTQFTHPTRPPSPAPLNKFAHSCLFIAYLLCCICFVHIPYHHNNIFILY
jgi:hypothetical protein